MKWIKFKYKLIHIIRNIYNISFNIIGCIHCKLKAEYPKGLGIGHPGPICSSCKDSYDDRWG